MTRSLPITLRQLSSQAVLEIARGRLGQYQSSHDTSLGSVDFGSHLGGMCDPAGEADVLGCSVDRHSRDEQVGDRAGLCLTRFLLTHGRHPNHGLQRGACQ